MRFEMEFDEGQHKRLQSAFNRYPIQAAEAGGKGAKDGASHIAKTLRATTRFKDKSGKLRKSIRIKGVEVRRPDAENKWHTIRRGAYQVNVRAPHAHLVEFGRQEGVADSGRKYPGAAGTHFIEKGVEKAAQAALTKAERKIEKEFNKSIQEIK